MDVETMRDKDKINQILEWWRYGKIKRINDNCYSVPNEAFELGITPTLISNTLRGMKNELPKDTDDFSKR